MQLANYFRGYDGPMTSGNDFHHSWFAFALAILLLLVISLVIYYLLRALHRLGSPDSMHRDPLDIVKERYARGDITRKEFVDIKKDLK